MAGSSIILRVSSRALARLPACFALVALASQVNCAGQSVEQGADCVGLCKKGKECPDAPRVDCEGQCLYEDARADTTGCRRQYDAIRGCSAELDDICTTASACKNELDAFWACVLPWCAEHPSSQYCLTPESRN